jgi:hypothetical protein
MKSKRSKMTVIHLSLATIVISMMLFIGMYQLNLKLIYDDASNIEEINGNIEEIKDVLIPPKFYYLGDRVRPKIIKVDGIDYYIMTIGDFAVGDDVTIEYLPNSRIVISIFSNGNN